MTGFLGRNLATTSHYSCMAASSVGIPTIDIIRLRLQTSTCRLISILTTQQPLKMLFYFHQMEYIKVFFQLVGQIHHLHSILLDVNITMSYTFHLYQSLMYLPVHLYLGHNAYHWVTEVRFSTCQLPNKFDLCDSITPACPHYLKSRLFPMLNIHLIDIHKILFPASQSSLSVIINWLRPSGLLIYFMPWTNTPSKIFFCIAPVI